ncbi:MAG: excinuclease ABC subunit UvrA [Lachnospiraceae bacterium]|nr:excinuclease ABC subunit UvrA [Lachnospiraceae bacterium]
MAAEEQKIIRIKGASENNLKSVDLDIPRNEMVVFTGLSGSGKSSLAFDTIYAEGQRRYMESLSSYARQFLGQMEKPKVDMIEGLSPAISIDQKSTNRNPRSTVGTVTEIHDYLRLLYARTGIPHCYNCGREISRQSVDQMVEAVMSLPEGTRLQILAPVVRGRKGEHVKLLESARKAGYVRARVDGILYELDEEINLDKNFKHNIDIVVDRLAIKEGLESRLTDSIEAVLQMAEGLMTVQIVSWPEGVVKPDPEEKSLYVDDNNEIHFSSSFSCPDCGISVSEIEPRNFSFNNPFGACPSCAGLGYKMEFDPELLIPDKSLSIEEGAIAVPGWQSAGKDGSFSNRLLQALADDYGFDLKTPYEKYPKKIKDMLMYGAGGHKVEVHYVGRSGSRGVYPIVFEGLLKNVNQRYRECPSDTMKQMYESFMRFSPCEECQGKRLKKESLAVTVGGKNIFEVSDMTIRDSKEFFSKLKLKKMEQEIAAPILKEVNARLGFLLDVGLEYLTLTRYAASLSGGEAQRIRLATQIGSGLTGVLYILDEPSIGLHQRDNDKLLATLKQLRDLGNTLIIVEHDEDTIRQADYVVDIGPGAGAHGGEIVAAGTAEDIMNCPESITGDYLSGRKKIEVPETRRVPRGWIEVKGARENNLKNIDVRFPLGVMTAVTGVSGSGKSSLVNEILSKSLSKTLNRARTVPGKHDRIIGTEQLDKVIVIDQSPIGRTPRSNPATYTGVFDLIRDLFAQTPDARARGYSKGRFSFNVKGGRCESCTGDGIIKIEMHFLPDVYVKCDTCKGKRYNRETLEVKYKGKSIFDVLDMTVEEALEFFKNVPRIYNKIKTLNEVGLSYIKLGQSSTTLSGGEAQRVKLATELSRKPTGKTMYILDEPTTGLHFADVHKLVDILRKLSEGGNSVVVIEHNLEVIKVADYIIDMGPDGGDRGGTVFAEGTPEEIAAHPLSYTGEFLKKYLKRK